MLRVKVHNGDAESIVEALDSIEAHATIVKRGPFKSTIEVEGNEGDARNVLGQFGYDEIEVVP